MGFRPRALTRASARRASIPRGSSGAAAAAVYVMHKVLPLDHLHFGRLPAQTVLAAEAFAARAARFLRFDPRSALPGPRGIQPSSRNRK